MASNSKLPTNPQSANNARVKEVKDAYDVVSILHDISPLKRMEKEYQMIVKKSPPGCMIIPRNGDLTMWDILFLGPKGTAYEGGRFVLKIKYGGDYPLVPPEVSFKTKIYHPNVDKCGHICLSVIKPECWKRNTSTLEILLEVLVIMRSPNVDDPLDADIANVFSNDVSRFETTARDWTKRFAVL